MERGEGAERVPLTRWSRSAQTNGDRGGSGCAGWCRDRGARAGADRGHRDGAADDLGPAAVLVDPDHAAGLDVAERAVAAAHLVAGSVVPAVDVPGAVAAAVDVSGAVELAGAVPPADHLVAAVHLADAVVPGVLAPDDAGSLDNRS